MSRGQNPPGRGRATPGGRKLSPTQLAQRAEAVLDLAADTRRVFARDARGGLEPADLQTLLALYLKSPQGVGEIAKRIALRSQTVSISLQRLNADGLVAEELDERDRRRRSQQLTTKGRRRVVSFLVQRELAAIETDTSRIDRKIGR